MRRHWGTGWVVVVIGSALVVSARAQDPVPLPGTPAPSAYGSGVPAPSAYAAPPVVECAPGPEAAEAPPHRRPVGKCLSKCKDCLNKYGLACWSHHNSLGCSSFEAEYRFIFGSCRTFYGEPCERRPPKSPGVPGTPGAYGPAGGGCACP